MSMRVRDRRRRPASAGRGILADMDGSTLAALRIERFLETEPIVWLSTTSADGAPYLVPTWFAWDGSTIIIRSKPHARKVRNLRHDPRTMVALGDAEDDFDVGLLRAHAQVEVPSEPPALPATFLAKYAKRIAELGLTPTGFAAIYSATIRLTPERALGWHGRSIPGSLVAAEGRLPEERPSWMSGHTTAALRVA